MPTDEQSDVLGASGSLISNDWDWPVHGLRHPPAGGTSGWYVWTGELLADDDFSSPGTRLTFWSDARRLCT
jgi:hypothetical protein